MNTNFIFVPFPKIANINHLAVQPQEIQPADLTNNHRLEHISKTNKSLVY